MRLKTLIVAAFVALGGVSVKAQNHMIADLCVGSPDTVQAGQTVTISGTVSRGCYRIEGTVLVANGATLRAQTIYVTGSGVLRGQSEPTSAVIEVGGATPTAPDQYDGGLLCTMTATCQLHGTAVNPTFARVLTEPMAGNTTLNIASSPAGWSGQVVLAGTYPGVWNSWERPTITASNGSTIAFSPALQRDHAGAHDQSGALQFLPHVAPLTRSVVIRSGAGGSRGHVLCNDRALCDFQYVLFENLGRTTTDPIDNDNPNAGHRGTNQIGRYSLHFHHLYGPSSPVPSGCQFTAIGNVVKDGFKGGIVVHNSHFGCVTGNVVNNVTGAGIVTEDGSETRNLIEDNFVVGVDGTGVDRADDRPMDQAWHDGGCYWFRGPNNTFRNNVGANCLTFGVSYFVLGNGGVGGNLVVPIPAGPGQVPSGAVDMSQTPLREDNGTELYGLTSGYTIWDIDAKCCTVVYNVNSTIANTKIWNHAVFAHYGYGENNITFDNWKVFGDVNRIQGGFPSGFYWGDYIVRHFTIRNSNIQGMASCILVPIKHGDTRDIEGNAAGTSLIENTTLGCQWSVQDTTPYGVTGGGSAIPGRVLTLRNVTFVSYPPNAPQHGAGPPAAIFRNFESNPAGLTNPNIIALNRVIVESSNLGTFEAFAEWQRPDFVIPNTPLTVNVAGLTNQQARQQAGVSIYGQLMPSDAVVTPNVLKGRASGTIVDPPPPPPPPPTSDDDGDGVVNTVDQCPGTPAGTPVDGIGCPINNPPPPQGNRALADYSALPVCSQVGSTFTIQGHKFTLDGGPGWKVRIDGQWPQGGDGQGPHGYTLISRNNNLYLLAANSGVYQWTGATSGAMFSQVEWPDVGCRMPPSASGSTVLQQNGVLVDNLGGVWMSTCSYFKFASNCPDFIGTTIEEGIILRNYSRFPDPGIRSLPEGTNTPWNLKWCGGQMYVQTYPTQGTFGRWQGLSNPTTLAPANVGDCGSGPPPADSDNDGVLDGVDKCPGTPIGTPVDSSGCPIQSPQGYPTVSTITLLNGPLNLPDGSGQVCWLFSSVESPNWDVSRWGSDTHHFNVTIVPGGSGPLMVSLQLHSAGGNGYTEPPCFINTTVPGIYISPMDLQYDGIPDPSGGPQRFYSRWMGYADANGIFQPVTADRVVRYVRFVLTQTQRWTPDPNRVYVSGASMGGGGSLHVALLNPGLFASSEAVAFWTDLSSWNPGAVQCLAGMRWRTAAGPLCTDMFNATYLVQQLQGQKVPLFLSWNSNDRVINMSSAAGLMNALDATPHPYQAQWRVSSDPLGHDASTIPGAPHQQQRLNAPPALVAPNGSAVTAVSGDRTNIGSGPPPPVDTDGDGTPDSTDKCPTVAGPASNAGCPVTTQAELRVSPNQNKTGSVTLQGASFMAPIPQCVYLLPDSLTGPVTFSLDGVVVRVESGSPWDYNGSGASGNECGLVTFAAGPHTIRAQYSGGETSASFTVTSLPPPPADADGDGVLDANDKCPGTPPGAAVDANGCAATQRDTDGDSVNDATDKCPGTPPGTQVDAAGCPVQPPPGVAAPTVTFSTCSYVIDATAPDTTHNWSASFRRDTGQTLGTDNSAPFSRNATVSAGVHAFYVIWTATGVASVTSPTTTRTCGG